MSEFILSLTQRASGTAAANTLIEPVLAAPWSMQNFQGEAIAQGSVTEASEAPAASRYMNNERWAIPVRPADLVRGQTVTVAQEEGPVADSPEVQFRDAQLRQEAAAQLQPTVTSLTIPLGPVKETEALRPAISRERPMPVRSIHNEQGLDAEPTPLVSSTAAQPEGKTSTNHGNHVTPVKALQSSTNGHQEHPREFTDGPMARGQQSERVVPTESNDRRRVINAPSLASHTETEKSIAPRPTLEPTDAYAQVSSTSSMQPARPVIHPVSPKPTVPSANKNPAEAGEPIHRTVQVRIGTVEIQATTPPPEPAPVQMAPPAPVSHGFDDYIWTRNYQTWRGE